jgi:hypothetical protein
LCQLRRCDRDADSAQFKEPIADESKRCAAPVKQIGVKLD